MSVVNVRFARAASRSASVSLFDETPRSSDLVRRCCPASAAAALISRTTTFKPARAHTSAMPEPISPLPTTPIRLKSLPTNAVMGSEAICGHRLGSWARMRLVLTISRRDFLALGASAVAVVPLARSFPGPGARAIEPGNPFALRRHLRRPRRVVSRAVDPAHRRRWRSASDVTVTWELADDRDVRRDRSRPATSWPRPPRATACTSSPTLAGPAWYRFRSRRLGRARPDGWRRRRPIGDRTAHRRGVVPALRDRLLRRPPRHRRVGTRPRACSSATSSTSTAATRLAARSCAASTAAKRRRSTTTGPLRPVPRRRRPAGGRAVCAVAGDLGRPRGREQLRRRSRRRTDGHADVRRTGRLAAYQAWWEHMPVRFARPESLTTTSIIYRTISLGRARRPASCSTGASSAATRRAATSSSTSNPPCPEAAIRHARCSAPSRSGGSTDQLAATTATGR